MLKPYPQCDGVRGWGPTTEEEKSPELPLSLPGEDTPYGGHLPARKRVLTRSPLWCHPDLRPSSPPNCEKGRSERPPSLSPSGQAVRQTSAPTGSGQAPSALSPTQGPAALTPWCPGTTEQRPRGYQAQLLCIPSLGGTQSCPLGEILPGILQIWNCSALISLFQLACLTLAPTRVGPCLAVSQRRRGLPLSSTGISRPRRRAGAPWAPCSPQGRAVWPEDLLLLFSRPAVLPSFLALHLACGLSQSPTLCPVLHCALPSPTL